MAVWDILLTNPHQGTTFQVLKTAHLVHLDRDILGHIEGPGPTTLHKDGPSQAAKQGQFGRPSEFSDLSFWYMAAMPWTLPRNCHSERSWLDEVANAAKGFRWWLMRGWEVLPICRCTSRGWEDCREVRGYQSLSHTLTSRLWSIVVLSYVQRYVVFACDAKWLQLKWLTYCNVNLGLIHL